jgi:LmbE family N-acetylglucosaminyl deacetylase
MCIFAHPDDESLGVGSTLAKESARGTQVSLVCATRGEKGWHETAGEHPGAQALGRMREKELQEAAKVLGINRVDHLDYVDGELDRADPREAVQKITCLVREVRPQVVISFGPDGIYGHPDHIAICQLATAALVCAADHGYEPCQLSPHRVSKLYYFVCNPRLARAFTSAFGEISIGVDGVRRELVVWPDWAVSTCIAAEPFSQTCLRAILCHRTQFPSLPGIEQLSADQAREITGEGPFYRAYSLVNPGPAPETDLFAGL